MKSASIALALAVIALVGVPRPLIAQETKTARGTVAALADDSLTVKMQGQEMKFAVDSKTTVEAIGGSTKSRAAQAAGNPGPKLTEVLKVGQPVTVNYTESGAAKKAVSIRAVSSFSAPPAAPASADATKVANGTVKEIAANSLTLTPGLGAGRAAPQVFTIDNDTKVVGRGVGTTAARSGGKTAITDLVGVGDMVSVTYHTMGTALHAAEVRVTMKAVAK